MGDITSFPTRAGPVLVTDPKVANIFTLEAAEDIKAGQVVELDPTTGDEKIKAGDSDDSAPVVGVAMFDSSSGDTVTVCGPGTICYVANESGSVAVGEGVTIQLADADVGGAVLAYSSGAGYIVGVALEDISADGWGRALIMPYEEVIS